MVAGIVREGLSERTHATIEIASTTGVDFRPAVADEITLALSGIEDRRWTLRLGRAALVDDKDGSYRYRLELYDAAWLLGMSKTHRKFRNKSAQQIVDQVLAEHGVARVWQLTAQTPVRKYCAQYDESNLEFVERLLEFEGIFFAFDQNGIMVMGDTSTAAPRLEQAAPFELLTAAEALDGGDVGIFAIDSCAKVLPGGVTLGDYSWKTPDLRLREGAFAEVDADLERYEYPAGFRKPEQGARLAKRRLQALRTLARFVEGRATVLRLAPGLAFSFGSGAGKQFAGEHLVVHVEHRFRHAELEPVLDELGGQDGSYQNRFRAIPVAVPFRPPQRHERPTIQGTHTAMVRGPVGEEIHTDRHGRFKAQLHWDREAQKTDDDSRWLRKMQEISSGMTLARTDWEMFVGYIDGDPDRPVGLGRAINGQAVPAYPLPASMNAMTIKTPTSPATGGFNELKLDDTAGSQMMSLRAEKDMDCMVKSNKGVRVGRDDTHTVGTDWSKQVSGRQSVSVGGNCAATFGQDSKVQVQGSRSVAVGASEDLKVGGAASRNIVACDVEIVGGLRLTVAGSFQVPDLGAMAESAARRFVGKASPGALALYHKAQQLQSLPASVEGAAQWATQKTASWIWDTGTGAIQDAGEAAWDSYWQGADGEGIGEAVSDGWNAGLDSLEASMSEVAQELEDLIPTRQDIQEQLEQLKRDLEAVLPTEQSLQDGAKAALSDMTGGVSDSLAAGDYHLALQQAVDLFCTGGISRQAEHLAVKVVGGAYVTAAVGDTTWTVGKGYYAERVGAVKLTATAASLEQTVQGLHSVTVGGALQRMAGAAITMSAATSAITVGGAAKLKAGSQLEIASDAVALTGAAGLLVEGGGAKAALSPGSLSLTGKLELKAEGDIVVRGDSADIT